MQEAYSISVPPPVRPERMHGGRPVLGPEPAHPWESKVVLNPAGILVGPPHLERLKAACALPADAARRLDDAGGAAVLLYRAQGEAEPTSGHAASSIGLAVFTPDLEPVFRRLEPVLRPGARHCRLGVEDARCTQVGDVFYLVYTGYTEEEDGSRRVRVCLATSENLVAWEDHGPFEGDLNERDNKNGALLPEPVGGRWLLLHRPMAGPGAMAVHFAEADDPRGPWRSRGVLFASRLFRGFSRSWVGAGGPPDPLGDGRFLMIYHQGHFLPDGSREYDLSAALLDFARPDPVVSRIEPLMRPESALEKRGEVSLGVDNVLFTCANYRLGRDLVIPYAGADSLIFGARIGVDELVGALERSAA